MEDGNETVWQDTAKRSITMINRYLRNLVPDISSIHQRITYFDYSFQTSTKTELDVLGL